MLRALTRAFGDERDKMMHDGLEEGRAAFKMNDDPEWIRKMVEVEETTGGYIGAGRSFYTSFDFDETPVTEASTAPCDQPGFWANKLKEMGEMRLLAARSFIEFARRSGIEHTAVVPTGTDNNGQRAYDFDAVTRLANKMRGRPESNKPELKTEGDWQEAIEGVKLWRAIQKVDQLVKNGKIPSR